MRVLLAALLAFSLIAGPPRKSTSSNIRILEPGMYWATDLHGSIQGEWTILSIENNQGWLTKSMLSQIRTAHGNKIISAKESVNGSPWLFLSNCPSLSTSPTWAFALKEVSGLPLVSPGHHVLTTTHPSIGDIKIAFDPPSSGSSYDDNINCQITFGRSTQRIIVAMNCNESRIRGVALIDIDGDGKLDLIIRHVGYPGIQRLSLFLSTQASPENLVGPPIGLSHGGE